MSKISLYKKADKSVMKEIFQEIKKNMETNIDKEMEKRIKQGYVFTDVADFVIDDIEIPLKETLKVARAYFNNLIKMIKMGEIENLKINEDPMFNLNDMLHKARAWVAQLNIALNVLENKEKNPTGRYILDMLLNHIKERMREKKEQESDTIKNTIKALNMAKKARESKIKERKLRRAARHGRILSLPVSRLTADRKDFNKYRLEFMKLKKEANIAYAKVIKRKWLDKTRAQAKRVNKETFFPKSEGGRYRYRKQYKYKRKRLIEKFRDWLTIVSVYGEYRVVPMYDPEAANIRRPSRPMPAPKGYKQGLNPEFVKVVEKQRKPGQYRGVQDTPWSTSGTPNLRDKVLTIERHAEYPPRNSHRLKYRGKYFHLPLIYDVGTSKKEGLNFLNEAYEAAKDLVRKKRAYQVMSESGEKFYFHIDPTAYEILDTLKLLEKFTGGKKIQEITLEEFLKKLGYEVIKRNKKKPIVRVTSDLKIKKL